MKIIWTYTARKTYFTVLEYLDKEWGIKEIENFVKETERKVELLKTNPNMGLASTKRKQVRKCLISEINSLFYRVKPRNKEIELLLFWNNRQDPKKIKY